jgi:hypothetical protein
MRLKYIVIFILIALLAFTVVEMMKFESSIRKERKVTLYFEDDQKPLIAALSDEELRNAAVQSEYQFMAKGNYFSRQTRRFIDGEKIFAWEDIFLKGVNLGVAVPGKFPAEFSLSFEDYLEWFRLIGQMNSNVIRTYTILPPVFYQAFAYYNFHHGDRPVYLMQGVWAEVPQDEDYFNPKFTREFQKEIIDALDVIHGKAVLREKPGKASGAYAADVSRYVIAILLGREWEPGSVHKTNMVNKDRQFTGDFICMNDGSPMEAWLAGMLDFTVKYETQQYQCQRPVSFVNWLPLDPMHHSTEIIESARVREYDNDLESVCFSRFHATGLFIPGIFAAYHVYPYYPDFIYIQPSYLATTGNLPPDPYLAYLEDLKAHNPGMPLVIAEYGLPSSRGNSHYSPYGMHQGGHSEAEQAMLSIELTKDIFRSSCAGAIYFEWIDEWFKHNWLVMDFEQPADDRKLWHNMENPEQNFGILALEDKSKIIDGRLDDWESAVMSGGPLGILTDADATYFYLALQVSGLDLGRQDLYVAIDTYDEDKGDHRLPFTTGTFDNGFEFLVEFRSADSAAILVDEPYSVYTDIYSDFIPGYTSERNDNGHFIRQKMFTNRGRVSLLGSRTDSVIADRSLLEHGLSSGPSTSNADWYYDRERGIIEVRLDWHLLNVTDPAKRFVLDNKPGTPDIEFTKSEAFRLFLFLTGKNGGQVVQFPEDAPYAATWQEWDIPEYTSRLKPLYYSLKEYFGSSEVLSVREDDISDQEESFSITEFKNGRRGAVSISFDNAGYSQYLHAWPILEKYHLSATFGVDVGTIEDAPGLVQREDDGPLKRFGLREARELARDNEIALQVSPSGTFSEGALLMLATRANTKVRSVHLDGSSRSPALAGSVVFMRKSPGTGVIRTTVNGIDFTTINAGMKVEELNRVLDDRDNNWTILVYHHLYDQPNEIPHQVSPSVASGLFLSRAEIEKHIRLVRNEDYWIAPEGDVFRYMKEIQSARIRTERFENMIFLRILQTLDPSVYDYPLTVEYRSGARLIRIQGSEDDGTYENKNGAILFNAKPGNEVTIEIIE